MAVPAMTETMRVFRSNCSGLAGWRIVTIVGGYGDVMKGGEGYATLLDGDTGLRPGMSIDREQ